MRSYVVVISNIPCTKICILCLCTDLNGTYDTDECIKFIFVTYTVPATFCKIHGRHENNVKTRSISTFKFEKITFCQILSLSLKEKEKLLNFLIKLIFSS